MIQNRSHASHRRSALASLLVIVLLLPSSWGCGLLTDPVPPSFEKISIRAEVERDKKGVMEGDFRAFSTLKGMLVGAAVGAPSFALTGGLGAFGISAVGCSPTLLFYPFCVAIWTVFGAAGGFVVGLFGGIAFGIIGGLPSETANEMTEVLARLEEGRNFDDDFLAAIQRAIPIEKQFDDTEAEVAVTGRLEKFDLRQHSKDRVSIRLRGSMVQEWEGEDGKLEENTCKYRYDSDRRPADTWLLDGGAAFGDAMTVGMETLARWMNRDLEAFATRTELEETETDPDSCYYDKRWYEPFRRD